MTAFDLTFSAPKSASVLYALGDPAVSAAVEAAFTAAVEQAIASLSPRIGYTRTGHAGAAVVDTDGVFGVSYRHRTSRALDPQLSRSRLDCERGANGVGWGVAHARRAWSVSERESGGCRVPVVLPVGAGCVGWVSCSEMSMRTVRLTSLASTKRCSMSSRLGASISRQRWGSGRPGSWSGRAETRRRPRSARRTRRSRWPHDRPNPTKPACRQRRCEPGGAHERTGLSTWIGCSIVCSETWLHLR